MRGYGSYFPDLARLVGSPAPAVDNRPQVIGPNTAPTQADASAIVARVAHVLLQSELDWSAHDVFEKNPSLRGLTKGQIQAAITEALA